MRFLFLSFLAVVLTAKEPVYPAVESFTPGAVIAALAESRGWPLTGRDEVADRVRPSVGDRCVVLISMRGDRNVVQWLARFEVVAGTAEERRDIAMASGNPFELHTSSGRHYTFARDPVIVEVEVLGPLDQDERRIDRGLAEVKSQRARFPVNAEFLQIGLDRAAATILRLRDETGRVGIGMRGEPFPEEEVRATRARLAERGVTGEDERAVVGSLPALIEFFGIASRTPGLKEILLEVVDVPWWSLVKGLGQVNVNMNLDGRRLRPADAEAGAYVVPFAVELNDAPALMVELVAAPARAPGSTLAGVTALHAGRPNGKGKHVTIELLSASAKD